MSRWLTSNGDYLTQGDYLKKGQDEPLSDDQIKNSAGGYVWQIDNWGRLRRFLVLGSENGTYYSGEHKLTRENVRNLEECIKEDGHKTVSMIVQMRYRVPKRDTIIYSLALAHAIGDKKTKVCSGVGF